MDAVGRVGGQAGLPSGRIGGVPLHPEMCAGQFHRRVHAPLRRGDQLDERRQRRGCAAGVLPICARCRRGARTTSGAIRLHDIAEHGDAARQAFMQAAGDRMAQFGRSNAIRDGLPYPIGQGDAPVAQSRGQAAEIEVAVGVHQPRQDGHVAQVLDVRRAAGRAGPRCAQPCNAAVLDCQQAVGDGIAGNREDIAGTEQEHGHCRRFSRGLQRMARQACSSNDA